VVTARLRLRGFRAGDLDAYAAMQANPEVMRYAITDHAATRAQVWRARRLSFSCMRLCANVFASIVRCAMPKTTTMTVRLTPELSDKLETLARDTKRSKSYLASEAIASYVEMNAWQVARIKAALAEARSGAPGVPHEDVVRWIESWGAENEHGRPRPRKSK
jgi:RHH-type rel operon transcriptional repressor/antitoxin RelB